MEFVNVDDMQGFTCLCGNRPDLQGAYACDLQGNYCEPPPSDDEPGQHYRCDRCGRIFDGQTGEVKGFRKE